MSQSEQNALAEQWYAMMIKEDIDTEHEVHSMLSTLTPSISIVSSRDELQEQRDPRTAYNRMRQHRHPEGERPLDKNMEYRDHPDEYSHKKILQEQQQQQQQQNNSQTDFLDGIIKSLSELSNHEIKSRSSSGESKSILQENMNGWSIHDSQRRMQRSMHRSHRKVQEHPPHRSQERTVEDSNNIIVHQRSDGENEERRRSSPDPVESRSLPSLRRRAEEDPDVRSRRESREEGGHNDRILGEGEPRHLKSRYESHSSGHSRSQRSAGTLSVGDTSSNSFRKTRSWNVDKSLRNVNKSLFDDPTSPESAISTERSAIEPISQPQPHLNPPNLMENTHGIFAESASSRSSVKYSARPDPAQDRKPVTRERAPSLAFSSSKDAGKILQHFIPTACGPVNGVNGEDALNSVSDFFDGPIRSRSPKKPIRKSSGGADYDRRFSGENYPSRPQSVYSKGSKRTKEKSRRSSEHFAEGDQKLPKTKAQKKHEQEILRDAYKDSREPDGPEIERIPRDQQRRRKKKSGSNENRSSSHKHRARNEDNRSNDFEGIWAYDDRDAPAEISNYPNHEHRDTRQESENFRSQAFISPRLGTNFGAIAASVISRQGSQNDGMLLQQLTRCNAAGQESPPKRKDSKSSPYSFSMFEKIQRQLTSQTKIDSSGFPMDKIGHKSTEQEQRIQGKLDAVRARSMRNAKIFQQMACGEQNQTSKDEQANQLSFASFGEWNSDQLLSINKCSGIDDSAKKNMKGKRLDEPFDENTDRIEDIATASDTNHKRSYETRAPSSNGTDSEKAPITGLVAQKNIYENEISHYMYVAYSQFGQDAQKVLKLCGHHTMPTPDRRKGEIMIRVHASTVSAIDCAIRRGEWKNMSMDPYIIPGVAIVGKVMGREKKKSRPLSSCIEPGDNVLSLVRSGGNARYICLTKNNLIKVPEKLHPERAVCLVETYLTAFQALHLGQKGGLRYRDNCFQGQSILIMNGYSPLGKALIELSRLGGASICYGLINDDSKNSEGGESGSSPDDMNHRYNTLEQWGAIPLSSDPQDWLTLIGRQVDIFVTTCDPIQGEKDPNRITADHWKALKKDGQVHVVCSNPGMTELEQRNLIVGSQPSNKASDVKTFRLSSCRPGGREKMADRAVYYNLFDSWEGDRVSRVTAKKDLEHLIKLLDADLIHPEIAERVPLSKIAKAQRSLEHNKVTGDGHLICAPWLREKTKGQQKSTTKRQQNDATKYVI
jgi:NADPH:quinone reductase-like Zn-dependent oxidoreductase